MAKHNHEIGKMSVIWVVVLAIVLLGVIYGAYRLGLQKSTNLPPTISEKESQGEMVKPGGEIDVPEGELEESGVEESAIEVNFSKTGNLLDREEWILLYEEPGNPAIDVSLKFTPASRCDLGNGESACDTSQFENGSLVTVKGHREDKEVTVATLKLL